MVGVSAAVVLIQLVSRDRRLCRSNGPSNGRVTGVVAGFPVEDRTADRAGRQVRTRRRGAALDTRDILFYDCSAAEGSWAIHCVVVGLGCWVSRMDPYRGCGSDATAERTPGWITSTDSMAWRVPYFLLKEIGGVYQRATERHKEARRHFRCGRKRHAESERRQSIPECVERWGMGCDFCKPQCKLWAWARGHRFLLWLSDHLSLGIDVVLLASLYTRFGTSGLCVQW